MPDQLYYFAWGKPPQPWLYKKRESMYKRICRVLVRGKMNSCIIQFTDNNQKEVVSRFAIRKIKI